MRKQKYKRSGNYWLNHGVSDWGIVTDAETKENELIRFENYLLRIHMSFAALPFVKIGAVPAPTGDSCRALIPGRRVFPCDEQSF